MPTDWWYSGRTSASTSASGSMEVGAAIAALSDRILSYGPSDQVLEKVEPVRRSRLAGCCARDV